MSGDLPKGALTDPAFLVTAEPERVMALLALASGDAESLAAAVYRASLSVHRDAEAGVRRQVLAVDAARYGDRGLSERIAAVGIPGVPGAGWRVEWATGAQVHPGFLGTPEGTASLVSSVRGQEVVVDELGVRVSCASPDSLPRVLGPGDQVGVLPATGKAGPAFYHLDSHGPYVLGGDEKRVAVWDLRTRELVGELESEDDDLLSWAVVGIDGRPHVVTGSFLGEVEVWDLADRRRVQGIRGEDAELRVMASATVGGRPYVLAVGCDPYVGTPLRTTAVWSLDPLRQIDRLPVGAETIGTADLGDRCHLVLDDAELWELNPAGPVGDRRPGHAAAVTGVATTTLDGRPVAVTVSSDETLRLWDLATGTPVGSPLSADTNDYDGMTHVRTTLVEGRPHAVTRHDSGYAEYDRAWDLTTGEEAAVPPPHTPEPSTVDVAQRQVRLWDSTRKTLLADLAFPHPVGAAALTPTGRLLVGFGDDIAVLSRV
ncbi:WD40 repeat domain-containing protein [Streptomyces sp. 4F14]|uniref:WD40 repeat domain-containing protein n=1 Tax=Streptomyces sp. 4F14 TaxID=3394380 RepID=UPI003A8380A4